MAITFHDVLHRFQAGHGTGTTALKAKLLQQLTSIRETVLLEVFLNLQKEYNSLDQDRCLDILAVYGVDPRALQLLRMYWGRLIMADKDGGYYIPPFKGYHGVTQG